MGDLWDDLKNAGSGFQAIIDAKTKRLETALTVITILAGVAAAGAVVTVLRRR